MYTGAKLLDYDSFASLNMIIVSLCIHEYITQ